VIGRKFGPSGVGGVKAGEGPTSYDVSKMRPNLARHEKERLFDDAMKLKINMNMYKDEYTKLRTKFHILEVELNKKERLIDDLLSGQSDHGLLSKH
jgi:hypothetical protein